MPTERITTIGADLVGDLMAPWGTPKWCAGMRYEIQRILDQQRTDHAGLQRCLDAMQSYQGWRHLRDGRGRPFATFAEFCAARRPYGLGMPHEQLQRLLAVLETLGKRSPTPLEQVKRLLPLLSADDEAEVRRLLG